LDLVASIFNVFLIIEFFCFKALLLESRAEQKKKKRKYKITQGKQYTQAIRRIKRRNLI
jgi:hypothetical protein